MSFSLAIINGDNHSHIIYDDIFSMTQSAVTKGLHSISITEHIYQFEKPRTEIRFGSFHSSGRMFNGFEEYLLEFQRNQVNDRIDAGNQLKVRKGLEVDFSPNNLDQVSEYVRQKKWDILLISVHELKDGVDIEEKNWRVFGDLNNENSKNRWIEYLDLEKRALESNFISFNVLTHPTRLARSTPKVPENFDDMLVDLAVTAKQNEKALELNGNDITRDYPFVERLARACAKVKCRISFGSDAHHPNEVGRGLDKANELVERYDMVLDQFSFS
jgi:histidinol-phosphatase (PHP family)